MKSAPRRELALLLALFILAFIPRFYRLDAVPPGLNGDEVFNMIDAQAIGVDNLPVFIPGNLGREALYFYVLALSIRLFGATVTALRLPSVLFGSGSVLACYLFGRAAFGRRVGFVSAALIAVSLWPIMLSRIGLRAISLTFLTTLTVYLFYLALQDGRLRHWLLAGAALGLTLYTYIPGRVFPLVIAAWVLCVWWRRRPQISGNKRALVLSLLVAALIVAPFAVYMSRYPDLVNQRLVSMSNALDRARAGEPRALLASVGGVVRMFSIEGDREWRYHLSRRPVFDPLTSMFFYLGIGLSLLRAVRRSSDGAKQPEYALLLLWVGAMLAPNAVLNSNPSFIRAAGSIAPVYLLTGLGVDAALIWSQSHLGELRWLAPALVALGISATLVYASFGYFSVWANNAEVLEIYHADQALMARYLNAHRPAPETRVFVAYNYVYDRPTELSFSLFTDQTVAWFARDDTFPWPVAQQSDVREAWYLIPSQQRLPADALEQLKLVGKKETVAFPGGREAFTIYRIDASTFTAEPGHQMNLPFASGLQLLGYDLPGTALTGEEVPIRLYWQVADGSMNHANRLTYAQIHLADATGVVRARAESLLGYPQAGWRSGDRFIQDMRLQIPTGTLPGPTSLSFGLRDDRGESPDGMKPAGSGSALVVRSQPLTDFEVTPDMIVYEGGLVLAGTSFRPVVTPGAALNVALNWVALQRPAEDYRVQLQLLGGDGEPLLTQTFDLWPRRYPPTQWQALEEVTTFHGFRIPVDLDANGPVALAVRLLPSSEHGDQAVPVASGSGEFGELTWDLRPHLFDAPRLTNTVEAQFGEDIRLLGYEVDASNAHPGGAVSLKLAWQAINTPAENYTIFNHLVGVDGEIRGQLDSPPIGEAWLTRTWLPGEVVVEEREIPIRDDARPGMVQLFVGLYTSDDVVRLPVTVAGQPQPADQLLLRQVEIASVPASSR
ncbi:MAG TPA: glycosyltransferase family 39 protein [Candidatus Binatia bacterium]|nr:glycosyltransferase family 39 protein [Candidatus Binatia bacterium]